MKRLIYILVIALTVGITITHGQNIVLEREIDIMWIQPVTDIEGDGILELIGWDAQRRAGLYDGATFALKWTFPENCYLDEDRYSSGMLSPFQDFNSDGNKDLILVTTEGEYDVSEVDVGFKIYDIAHNSTLFEYRDPNADAWTHANVSIYLADIDGDHEIEIVALFSIGDGETHKTLIFSTGVALSAVQSSSAPTDFRLEQNYPNPFNPTTNISYNMSKQGHVVINVYDIKGREVGKLVDSVKSPGRHRTVWDGRQLSSGMYFYQIAIDGRPTAGKKAIFLK